jgi:hypothetical protein
MDLAWMKILPEKRIKGLHRDSLKDPAYHSQRKPRSLAQSCLKQGGL